MTLQDGFNVTAASGAVFDNVDLQDDFADYDGSVVIAVLIYRRCWRSGEYHEYGVEY